MIASCSAVDQRSCLTMRPVFDLSAELHLWRHEQDRVSAGIHDREQHDHLLAAINHFANADAQAVP